MRTKILKLEGTQTRVSKVLLPESFFRIPFHKIESKKTNANVISKDITRVAYIDAKTSYDYMCNQWKKAADQDEYGYSQGDTMGGANIKLTFDSLWITIKDQLKKGDEIAIPLKNNTKILSFSYINDDKKISSFSLICFENDPNRWIASILQNAAHPHDQQHCLIYNRAFEHVVAQSLEYKKKIEKITNLTPTDFKRCQYYILPKNTDQAFLDQHDDGKAVGFSCHNKEWTLYACDKQGFPFIQKIKETSHLNILNKIPVFWELEKTDKEKSPSNITNKLPTWRVKKTGIQNNNEKMQLEKIARSYDSSTNLSDLFASLKSAAIADFLNHIFLPDETINLEFTEFCVKTAIPTKCTKPIDLLFTYPDYSPKKLLEQYAEKKRGLPTNDPEKMSTEESRILGLKYQTYQEIIDRAQKTVKPTDLITKSPTYDMYDSLSNWISNLTQDKSKNSKSTTPQSSDTTTQELPQESPYRSRSISSGTTEEESPTYTSSGTTEEESSTYTNSGESSTYTSSGEYSTYTNSETTEEESSEDGSSNTPTSFKPIR